MWMKKILHKKMQFAIILLLTMVASAIVTACVAFPLETQRYVEEYYSIENNPFCFLVLSRGDGKELIMGHEESAKLVDHIEEGRAKVSTQTLYHNDKAMPNGKNIFYRVEDICQMGYQMSVVAGEEAKAPANDEIWISHVYADAYDVCVGDRIRVKDMEFKVGAVVNTAINSSGFIDEYPFYVSGASLERIEGLNGFTYSLYVKDAATTTKQLTDALPEEIFISSFYYIFSSNLKMCLGILSGIFGGVGIAAGLIISAVSVIVLRYLVRATISKEYRIIGTYKAMGMDNAQIKSIYLLSYMTAGCLGMIPGILIGQPIAVFLSRAVLGGTKKFELSGLAVIVGVLTVLVMSFVLYFNIRGELRRVQKISPVQAMQINMLSSSEHVTSSLIKNAHSAFSMAVNHLWKRRGMTILTILILFTSVYMDLVAASVALTLSHYKDDRDVWENLPSYDCIVQMYENKDAIEFVKNCDLVQDYVAVELDPNYKGMTVEGTEKSYYDLHPMVYEDFTEERYENVPFTKGRICVNPHEITASNDFLKEVDKKVGDYIEIGNGEKTIRFLIAGSYTAKMEGGTSFYVRAEDMKELGFEDHFSTLFVFLREDVTLEEFSGKLETEIADAHVYEDFAFIEQEGKTVGDIANPICLVLFVAFSLFSILNLVNLIYTQNRENRRKHGILKAMGFTSAYIQRENVIAFTIEYLFAVILTVILQKLLSPSLFSIACGVRFIFSPVWLTVIVCGGMYAILLFIIMSLSVTIRRIKPVELMEE